MINGSNVNIECTWVPLPQPGGPKRTALIPGRNFEGSGTGSGSTTNRIWGWGEGAIIEGGYSRRHWFRDKTPPKNDVHVEFEGCLQ